MDAGPRGGPLVRRLLNLAVLLGSLAALAWLAFTEHDQLGRANSTSLVIAHRSPISHR